MAGDKTYITDSNGKLHRATRTHKVAPESIVWSNNPNDYAVQVRVDGKWHRAFLTMDAGTATYFDNINIDKALVTGTDGKTHTCLICSPEASVTMSSIKTDQHSLVNGTTTGETAVNVYSENWSNVKWQDNVNVYKVLVTGSDGKVHTALLTTSAGGGVQVIVLGTSPLVLPDAIANSLSYVKAFGGTEQRNLPDNYVQRQFIYMMDDSYLVPDIIPEPDWHIEMDFQTTAVSTAGVRTYFGGRYDSSPAGAGIRFGHTSSKKVVLYGFDTNNAYTGSTYNMAHNIRYKYVYNNNSASLSTGGTVVESTTFTPNDTTTSAVGINSYRSQTGGFATTTEGIYLYSFKAWNGQGELVADYVPAIQKGTVPVVGFYDTVSGTFKTATAGTFAAGGEAVPTPDAPMDIVCNNGVLRIQGSATGTVTQTGNPTPTTPVDPVFYQNHGLLLRAIGTDADTYDASTQTITRAIGYHIFDGTESFSTSTAYGRALLITSASPIWGADRSKDVLCQYFLGTSDPTNNMPEFTCFFNATGHFYLRTTETATDFKAWLAELYANGTPLIVWFVKSSTETESFTPSVYADGTQETINVHSKNLWNPAPTSYEYFDVTANGVKRYGHTYRNGTYTAKQNGTGGPAVIYLKIFSNGSYGTAQVITTAVTVTVSGDDVLLVYVSSGTATDTTDYDIQVERGADATDYQPYFDGGTAVAEMLLKVGDYQDEQEILSGVVTRNVGVKVLDGTNATFTRAADNKFYPANTSDWAAEYRAIDADHNKVYIMSNQFASHTWNQDASLASGWSVSFRKDGANSYIRFLTTGISTVADFNAFLAQQYAAGTPVIVLYPLATPTTESVAGQTLQVTDGDNTLEIAQASLTGLELEVEYQAAVTLTVQEVQDANLDNNVEVTIQ